MSGVVYLLDTNVLSELMRPGPSPAVLAWIGGAGVESLALSAVSRSEIRYGLALLPEGKRRDDLAHRFDGLVSDLFAAGVYDLTSTTAERCAWIVARERAIGESLGGHLPDAMIAGIAAQAGLTVATRNRAELRNCGRPLVDPWPAAC
jgi:toxin FitB